jgi:hypothetical protein
LGAEQRTFGEMGGTPHDSLKKEEEKIVARRMQLAKKTGMPYNFC